jgi:hypothetical protein
MTSLCTRSGVREASDYFRRSAPPRQIPPTLRLGGATPAPASLIALAPANRPADAPPRAAVHQRQS